MSKELLNGVEISRELLLGQRAMDKLVASATQEGKTPCKFGFVEGALGLTLTVTGTRDQVMAGELDFSTLAEFAAVFGHML